MITTRTARIGCYRDANAAPECPVRESSEQRGQTAFIAALAIVFIACLAVTIIWCRSMSAMGGMAMPGGWTMSMAWMLMPGQSWLSAAASFLGMWDVMMAAMMLPSLTPMLARYRATVGAAGETNFGLLTTLVAAGYVFVWTAIGLAVYSVGFALSALEMEQSGLSRVVPAIDGLIVLTVGALQFTGWKARCLTCCRETPALSLIRPADIASAWRHGLRIGVQCARCCFGLMAIVVVLGVMDLRLMAIVTAAITAERLAPHQLPVARAFGYLTAASGIILIAQAGGLW